jgi:hypothetical protein
LLLEAIAPLERAMVLATIERAQGRLESAAKTLGNLERRACSLSAAAGNPSLPLHDGPTPVWASGTSLSGESVSLEAARSTPRLTQQSARSSVLSGALP